MLVIAAVHRGYKDEAGLFKKNHEIIAVNQNRIKFLFYLKTSKTKSHQDLNKTD